MRNRYFPLFMGIGILCVCGLIVLVAFRPQNQTPIKIYKTVPLPTKQSVPDSEISEGGETTATQNLSTEPTVDVGEMRRTVEEVVYQYQNPLVPIDEAETQKLEQLLEIINSQEFEDFMNAKTQDLKKTYEETGRIDFSLQDYFDFLKAKACPALIWRKNCLKPSENTSLRESQRTIRQKWLPGSKRQSWRVPVHAMR